MNSTFAPLGSEDKTGPNPSPYMSGKTMLIVAAVAVVAFIAYRKFSK